MRHILNDTWVSVYNFFNINYFLFTLKTICFSWNFYKGNSIKTRPDQYKKISFKKLSFTIIRLFFVLFFCTHCKKEASFQRVPSSVEGELTRHSHVSVLINNGDEYTKEENVTLTFTPSTDADEMFISFDSNCSQGEWEVLPESKSKNIELNQLNQENTVYVKYRYLGREETQCVNDSIIHAVPKRLNYEVQGTPKVDIMFIVDTSISMDQEREKLADKIDGFINKISHLDWQIVATTTTVYSQNDIFSVERINYDRCLFDQLNNHLGNLPAGEISHNDWSDTSRYVSLPSYTMSSIHRKKLKGQVSSVNCQNRWLSDNPYNWQHGEHSEGRLTDFTGTGVRILKPGINNAQQLFGDRIEVFPNGDAREQGIHAAVKSVKKYKEDKDNRRTTDHTSFFRDGANLVFVLLADEDENSLRTLRNKKTGRIVINNFSKWNDRTFYNNVTGAYEHPLVLSGTDFKKIYNHTTGIYDTDYEIEFSDLDTHILSVIDNPVCPECPPQKFQKFIKDTFGSQKNMTWHSIIKTENNCSSGTAHLNGYMYEALSYLTGGIVGDVCASDYTSQLQSIGSGVARMGREISLDCKPLDINRDGVGDVRVLFRTSNSTSYQNYSGTYRISGQKLIFNNNPIAGQYQVDYNCSI